MHAELTLEMAAGPPTRGGAAAPVAPPALVRRMEVVGTSLPPEAIRRLSARFLDRPLDAATGAEAAAALDSALRRADTHLFMVGAPGVGANGVLTLAAIEGRVVALDVEGGSAGLRRRVRAAAGRLLAERPLRRASFERVAALLALLPGVRAGTAFVVTPEPGAMRLRVLLVEHRARVDLKLSNRGAEAFGAWRGQAEARAYGLLAPGDQAVLSVGAAPDLDRLRLVGGTYVRPLGADGLTLVASATHVEGRPYGPGAASSGFSALAALAYPVVLRAGRTLTLTAAADAQDGRSTSGALTTGDERTRNLRFAVAGARLLGAGALATGGATLTAGLAALGARAARPGYAPTGYGKLQAFAAISVPRGDWTFRLRAAGQAAGSRLPFSEQFTLGGDDYGRGFRGGALQGDDGFAAAAEAARTLRRAAGPIGAVEAFAYLDAGGVRLRRRPGEPPRSEAGGLASAGAGVRVGTGPAAGLELTADRALVYDDPLGRRDGGWRLGLRLHLAWEALSTELRRPRT